MHEKVGGGQNALLANCDFDQLTPWTPSFRDVCNRGVRTMMLNG